jgi:hypothetical protein
VLLSGKKKIIYVFEQDIDFITSFNIAIKSFAVKCIGIESYFLIFAGLIEEWR